MEQDRDRNRQDGGAANAGGGGREMAARALDPAARGELLALLRELLWRAVGDIVAGIAQHANRRQAEPTDTAAGRADEPAAQETAAAEPTRHSDRRYRYAHGDVDLSRLPANVPTADERRPRRGGGGRRFYFLPDGDDAGGADARAGEGAGGAATPARGKT